MKIDEINAKAVMHAGRSEKHSSKASELCRGGLAVDGGSESKYRKADLHREAAEYHDKAASFFQKASEAHGDGKMRYADNQVARAERWAEEAEDHEDEHGLKLDD